MVQKKKDDGLTPMMRQFYSFKEANPDALLLFRCGDFYETYADDAVEAAKILGITLTRRSNGKNANGAACEMAGFPYHALDTYLPKLIRAGKRVAICDQLEDPKLTKTLVKRGVTELVTPGVSMDDTVLNYKENNFLAAVHMTKTACGVSFLDISTGEFLVGEGTSDYVEKLLVSFQPKEVLHDRQMKREFEDRFGNRWCTFQLDDWMFTEQSSRQKLLKHFGTQSLKGFGVEHLTLGVVAAGVIMQYLEMTQHTNIGHITSLRRIEEDRYVRLDKFTIRSLELLGSMQEDGSSLLDVIDRTTTAMGARMLKRWTVFPLRDVATIGKRLDVVETFFRKPDFRQVIDEQLHRIGDIERIISKVAVGRVSPREVVQMKLALQALVPVKSACLSSDCEEIRSMGDRLNLCESLRDRIEREIQSDPPLLVAKGDVIASGYSEELDELRSISRGGRDYLLKIQEEEAAKTGIQSLKVGYNNVFGYYLEVRNTYKDAVPQEWIRKQTLANAERYITQELKEYEEKIMGADEKILALESRLFNELVTDMAEFVPQIQINANIIARIDCLLSFAKAAEEHRYVRPVVADDALLEIQAGRHPVIETQLPVGEQYVPNDIKLDTEKQQIMIITGPNMAGKSALLRQTALITLMAQMGSFVPADSAHIGLVDKIFTRVGASDNISLGESTFMVEMTEASDILNNVTPRSLVLFDELGRGTSTYDGISIAWAIVEYLHQHSGAQARTLFATHYHELNEMEKHFERIKNYNVSVKEVNGKVIFLRKLMPGGSEHSFGIHVAEIAGMPKSIVNRANAILRQLEADNAGVGVDESGAEASAEAPSENAAAATVTSVKRRKGGKLSTRNIASQSSVQGVQLSFFQLDDPVLCQIRDEIIGLDINNLTPVEALNKLNEIKKIVTGRS
ncbi:DNA mismatch repair protein MutS [uncultured Prevotella sp.]|jgi:DNA mismatch repair protein MutS|uniref:DNA mismatch repair protein MutS n=1 Tax=uncultured Prevotella sp. TaxID=159272 RepID=UPI0025E93ECE|nr:DNA mismatch repair protein MutS [uncultured Prevotella sp.]MBD9246266.1 DNA mismatch repair protein MutS [Prevotella sp.]